MGTQGMGPDILIVLRLPEMEFVLIEVWLRVIYSYCNCVCVFLALDR